MSAESPRISIGLPVYNGERYLAAALDSILAQTYRDFELIIADNASSDGTWAIVERYRQRDARIRAYRHSRNMGAAANFNFTFAYARGEYFKWAAHDDLLEPAYLESCYGELSHRPDAVLCSTRAVLIDSAGQRIRPFDFTLDGAASSRASERLAAVLLTCHWFMDVFGLIRRDALLKTQLIAPTVMSDKTLLADLALQGSLLTLDQPLFLSREHEERSVRAIAPHRRQTWFAAKEDGPNLPHWTTLLGYWRVIQNAQLSHTERVRCTLVLLRWAFTPRNLAWLALDPVIAAAPALGDALWALKQFRQGRSVA